MSEASGSSAQAQSVPRCVLLVGETGAVPSSLVGALDRRGLDIVIVRHAPQVMLELAPVGSPAPGSAPSIGSGPRGSDTGSDSASPDARPAASAPDESPDPDDAHRSAPSLSVVIVEPQQQPRIDELRQAVADYYPAVRCWQYHAHGPDGHPALETLIAPESTPLSPPPPEFNPESSTGDPQNAPDGNPTAFFVDVDLSKGHTSTAPESPATPADDDARVKGASQRLRSLVVKVDDPQRYDDGPLVSEEELAMLLGPDPSPPPTPGNPGSSGSHEKPGPAASARLGISPDSRHDHGERE